jgi:colanic acid/amylovoran biosynthesis glycosyltransferase
VSRVTLVVNGHGAASETFQRALARTLSERHEVTLHAIRPGGASVDGLDGIAISSGLGPIGPRSAPRALARMVRGPHRGLARAAWRARRLYGSGDRAVRAALLTGPILETDPDVLHLGFSGLALALRDALPLLPGVRVVVSCRGTDELVRPELDPDRAAALGSLLASVDGIHVVADAIGDAVVALGAPPDRVRVIRPAVDLAAWPERPVADDPAAASPDGPTLVAVARLHWAKGIEDLLAALAAVRAGGTPAHLVLVGDGPHRDAVFIRILRSGLADAVTLAGSLPPDRVREALAGADLFVSPSLSEGINNGVLEAMATGLPVVSTDVGGMGEVLTDGVDGWLVPAGRPDLLAARITAVLADPPGAAEVAQAGRRRVEEAFGLGRQQAEVLAFYDEVLVRAPRSGSPSVDGREDAG